MEPLSESHQLKDTKHYLSALPFVPDDPDDYASGSCITGFYAKLGMCIMGTVMDGDCGPDTASQMLGWEQSQQHRHALREEISDYLMARVRLPWMQELMANLQEIRHDDLERIRSCGSDVPNAVAAVAPPSMVRQGDQPMGQSKNYHQRCLLWTWWPNTQAKPQWWRGKMQMKTQM